MRSWNLALAALLVVGASSPVLAKGCLRGAAVGGVAGHYVGRGHAVAGAAVGCLAARHHYARVAREKAAARPRG